MSKHPIIDELGRGQFTLLVEKDLDQREEHITAKGMKYTKMHPFTHNHVFAFDDRSIGFKLDVLHPEFVTTPQYALPDLFTDDGERVRLSYP